MNDDPPKLKEGCGGCCGLVVALIILVPLGLVLLGMPSKQLNDIMPYIIVGGGGGLLLAFGCLMADRKKRIEKAEEASKNAPPISTPAPDSPSTTLDSSKLEALRKYLTESGFADNNPMQNAFSLWMTKGEVDGQAEFAVKSINGHLNVSGGGDVDRLREDLAQLWLARSREQVLGWLQSHERQEVPLIVNKESSVVTKATPPTIQNEVRFFIFKPGEAEAQGPFDLSQIEALRTCGVVSADTQFCREGENEWKPTPLL